MIEETISITIEIMFEPIQGQDRRIMTDMIEAEHRSEQEMVRM